MALEDIKRRGFASQVLIDAESAAIHSAQTQTEHHIAAYNADERSLQGRYVCADLFKETFPHYRDAQGNKTQMNGAVHNSASVLAAELFRRRLSDGESEKNDVFFLTGIPGAGKTSSIIKGGQLPDTVRMVFEGQLSNPQTTLEKIQQVLDAKLKPEIMVVHQAPEIALENTIKRFHKEGRGASINVMATIQSGLPASLNLVKETYGDKVQLTILDRCTNELVKGWEHLERIQVGNNEQIKERLTNKLDALYTTGAINDDDYQQAAGTTPKHIRMATENASGVKTDGGEFRLRATNRQPSSGQGTDDAITQEYDRRLNAIKEQIGVKTKRLQIKVSEQLQEKNRELKHVEAEKPGFLALPAQKKRWDNNKTQLTHRITTLENRLEQITHVGNQKQETLAYNRLVKEDAELVRTRNGIEFKRSAEANRQLVDAKEQTHTKRLKM